MAEWTVAGKTVLQIAQHERYEANKDAVKARAVAWALAHPEEVREIKRRSAVKRAAEGVKRKPGKPKDPVKVAAYNKRYYHENLEAMLQRAKNFKMDNPEKVTAANKLRYETPEKAAAMAEANRQWQLEKKYGLSVEQYDTMLSTQNNCCAICGGRSRAGRNLSVDHDHRTGSVRGLLCDKCNAALGMVNDNPEILMVMIEYLAKYRR